MNLLLDVGNTNLRWCLDDGEASWVVHVVRHHGSAPLDLLEAWHDLACPARILVSNVGGAALATDLAKVTCAYWRREPEFIATRACLGDLRIAYADPERFGVDRWLTLLAAREYAQRSALIVDAGTAVTYDLLCADGRHLGGLILPGIEMMRASLLAGTHIPRVGEAPVDAPWAADTLGAVNAGGVQALAALTTRLYERLAEQADAPPLILLTGGDAGRLHPALDRPDELVPDLVLRGIAAYARRIAPRPAHCRAEFD